MLSAFTETKDWKWRYSNRFLSERASGSFTRTIELPVAVDAKKIKALFKDGVLEVTLPKTEDTKPKQIEVKVS